MALNISSNIVASEKGRELVQHGSALFPIACYAEDLSSYSVAWHWHEEFEYVLCTKGPLHVDVNKTRLTLQTGQGVFINSGVLHAVEQAPEGTALLHSGVFHPRLVGGMDTIFWQKLIRPMTQSDAPPFFLLDGLVPWQKQVLDCLHESWKAVSDEPFDYENRVRYYLSLALRLLSTQCVGGRTKSPSRSRSLRADEADAPLRGGTLRGRADSPAHRGQRGPQRERLSAQFQADAGHHAHPVRQAVPGGKGC